MRWRVTIREVYEYDVVVEADSRTEARKLAREGGWDWQPEMAMSPVSRTTTRDPVEEDDGWED